MLVEMVVEWIGISDSSDQISGGKRSRFELVADMGSSPLKLRVNSAGSLQR